ncbi:MAG: hypothetical protein KKA90_04870 [Nanoarchaeota archaeon]|nr:hypothetical protein [Nanoarchaeota archaeon]
MRQGISLISGVLFLAITITATIIVIQAAIPLVEKLQATAAIEKMKGTFAELDQVIRDVAAQGNGSRRTVSLLVDPGELVVNNTLNLILWTFETKADVITPRTAQRFGNLIIGANLETSLNETTLWGNTTYRIENEHLIVYINKTGNRSSPVTLYTDQLLLAIYNKDTTDWLQNPGFFKVSIDNSPNSVSGLGYTIAVENGSYLPFGQVNAIVNSTYLNYTIKFILESGADFITIEGE